MNKCNKQGWQHEDNTTKHGKPMDEVFAAKNMDNTYLSSAHPSSSDSTNSKISGVYKIVPSHNSASI